MGDTLKLLREGDLIEWLQGPNAGVRARVIIRERRYFAIPVDGPPRELSVELEEEGSRWNRLGAKGRR